MLIRRPRFTAITSAGGPIERVGRLKYIDGCTDSLLVSPPKLGDPCLNALYFPPKTRQTFHTHPSIRIGIVIEGEGQCDSRGKTFGLSPGDAFYLPANVEHRFRTGDGQGLVVIAYHPDSDFGPQHEDHPMVNRTIVDGVSAVEINDIRTN